jgi:hypothetical protein
MVNKKASGLFRSLAYGIYGILFVFCGKLFCHLQQTVKGLLFFRLLDQRCKERTEHIGAVVPQRNCNFVDHALTVYARVVYS